MWKLVGVVCTASLLCFSARSQGDRFTKYKKVEAYEIRPGILMMPQYSADGQVCEVGLETRHYSPEVVRMDSKLSRKVIDQIVDELAPHSERGPRSKALPSDLVLRDGDSNATQVVYENVSIVIYSRLSPTSKKHESLSSNVAATITWKERKCQK